MVFQEAQPLRLLSGATAKKSVARMVQTTLRMPPTAAAISTSRVNQCAHPPASPLVQPTPITVAP